MALHGNSPLKIALVRIGSDTVALVVVGVKITWVSLSNFTAVISFVIVKVSIRLAATWLLASRRIASKRVCVSFSVALSIAFFHCFAVGIVLLKKML